MKRLGMILCLLMLAQTSVCATEYFVRQDGNNANDGKSWANAKAGIQAAVDATAAGDIVTVSNGTYTSSVSVPSYALVLTNTITVRSVNGPGLTLIDAGNVDTRRVAKVNAEGAMLEGFTLTKGSNNDWIDNGGPAAVLLEAGQVTNCILTGNKSYLLGTVYVNGGTLTDCIVRGNTTGSRGPGGIEINAGAVLNCTITNNTTAGNGEMGGGIYVRGGLVSNCLISANTTAAVGMSNGRGGGVHQTGGLVVNCEISDNFSHHHGGGVYQTGGILRNALVSGNNATIEGGGLYQIAGVVENCTIVNNNAIRGNGDGIWMSGGAISNSIAYQNMGNNLHQTGGNIAFSCIGIAPLPTGEGNVNTDPDFVDPLNKNYGISAFSPCFDTGSNQTWMADAVDRDGNARLFNSLVDMGAYERTSGAGSALQCTFSAPTTLGLETLDVTFTAEVSGDNTNTLNYTWDFGDSTGTSGTDKRVVNHSYSAGYFTVVLTVSNELEEAATRTRVAYIKVVPDTCYVSKNGSNIAPYETWARAAASVESAVAVGSATVLISNGTYSISGEGIAIVRDMTIRGVNGPEVTVLDGGGITPRRIFFVNSPGARIEGITATRGKWNERTIGGGAIGLLSGLVTNCIINASGSYDHGSVYINGGTLTDSIIRNGNSGSYGPGGIVINAGAVLNCTITNNVTANNNGSTAGGMSVVGGTVSNCLIRANTGFSTAAGGVLQAGGIIVNCKITDNSSAASGGGIRQTGGILRNALLARNTGKTDGGGLYLTAGTVENCTVTSNKLTTGSSSGIWMSGGSVSNSIAYFNGADNLYKTGGTVAFSCITPLPTGAGNISENPNFIDALNKNYRLSANSPCLNVGANQAWMRNAVDLDGNPRIGSSLVDMGAYEVPTPPGTVIIIR